MYISLFELSFRFEMGSLFDLNAGVDELSLLSAFHLHLPSGENHNVGIPHHSLFK